MNDTMGRGGMSSLLNCGSLYNRDVVASEVFSLKFASCVI